MATRLYSIGPNERVEDIVEAVGSATTTKSIELTVDLGAIKAAGNPSTSIYRDEVLHALMELHDYIQKSNWPPA
jgi:hypothetical protein